MFPHRNILPQIAQQSSTASSLAVSFYFSMVTKSQHRPDQCRIILEQNIPALVLNALKNGSQYSICLLNNLLWHIYLSSDETLIQWIRKLFQIQWHANIYLSQSRCNFNMRNIAQNIFCNYIKFLETAVFALGILHVDIIQISPKHALQFTFVHKAVDFFQNCKLQFPQR